MSKTIKLPTKELKEMLQLSSSTVSKEKNNILSNALIEIEENTITVISKNPITKSIQKVNIEPVKDKHSFLVNPVTLFNIVKELEKETTQIIPEEKVLKIVNGNFTTNIKTLNKELYPKEQELKKEKLTQIDFNKLKHITKIASAYPDKNDISREYTGVLIEIEKNSLKATATDHFRLINITTEIEEQEKQIKFILENYGAVLMSRIDMDEKVEIYKNENTVEIRDSKRSIELKIIKGEFPDYNSILLNENNSFITIKNSEFLNSIKRVSVTNRNDEIELEITPSEKNITVFSRNQEGEESTEKIAVKEVNTNDGTKIKLNSKFITNYLSQINSEYIYLFYKSSEEPIMMKSEDGNYVYNYIMTPIIN